MNERLKDRLQLQLEVMLNKILSRICCTLSKRKWNSSFTLNWFNKFNALRMSSSPTIFIAEYLKEQKFRQQWKPLQAVSHSCRFMNLFSLLQLFNLFMSGSTSALNYGERTMINQSTLTWRKFEALGMLNSSKLILGLTFNSQPVSSSLSCMPLL